nr:glycosyltransferase [Actinomycetospora corticicola]
MSGDLATAIHEKRRWNYELVVVTYHSRPLVESMFERLPVDLPIVIVDNAQGADGMGELIENRPSARYLTGPGRGYPSGANLGVLSSTYDYVVLVDPDTSPAIDQIDSLVRDLEQDPGLAAVEVMTVEPDGRAELSGGWEPTPLRAFVHAAGLHKLFPTAGLYARPVPGQPLQPEWMSGSCTAVPVRIFRELGGFDESYFVYSDDVEFGRRVREAGLRLRLRTDICMQHLGTGSGEGRPRMLRYRGASMTRYLLRYNTTSRTNAMRVFLSVGLAARIPLCLLRNRRAQVLEHVAYLRGLWFGPPT